MNISIIIIFYAKGSNFMFTYSSTRTTDEVKSDLVYSVLIVTKVTEVLNFIK